MYLVKGRASYQREVVGILSSFQAKVVGQDSLELGLRKIEVGHRYRKQSEPHIGNTLSFEYFALDFGTAFSGRWFPNSDVEVSQSLMSSGKS